MQHKLPNAPLADIVALLADIAYQRQEHFVVITFDGQRQLINKRILFIGTVNGAPVHPREIFAAALEDFASSIIIAHNHPSGDPSPSDDDIKTTQQLVKAGTLMCIELLDHVIVAGGRYVSFAANGLIDNSTFAGPQDAQIADRCTV